MARHVLQGTLVLNDQAVEQGQVVLEEGRIVEVALQPRYDATRNFGEGFVIPGLIDVHVHGIAGADMMQGRVESVGHMARRYAAHGVTGFLATTLTESREVTQRAVEAIRTYMEDPCADGAVVLGIHLEGPFLNPGYKGMQFEGHLERPDMGYLQTLLTWAGGKVVRVSLAPEMPGAGDLVEYLCRQGIYVSIAHTGATFEEALDAVLLGATQVTHSFNAMTGLHHRKPGVVGAALVCDDLYTELIADGIHVHPAVMRLLVRVKGRGRMMLVTDAMPATEMADGEYPFGGHRVIVRSGRAALADGTLAGSTLTMDRAVRNIVRLCGISVVDAVYMASTTPAESMGLRRKGKLVAGHDADIAVLSPDLAAISTWVAGEEIWAVS